MQDEYRNQERFGFRVDIVGKSEGIIQDLMIHNVGVFIVKRRQTTKHLVEQDAQGPPIHRFRVAFSM